jgi:hypothetical protein
MWRRIIATAGLFLLGMGLTAVMGHLLPAPFADLTRALVVIALGAMLMAMAPAVPVEREPEASFFATPFSSNSSASLDRDRPIRQIEPLRAVPPSGLSSSQPEKLM